MLLEKASIKSLFMKKFLILFLFVSSITKAQFTIKGKIHPVKGHKWALLYKVEGARQEFIKNSQIKEEVQSINGKNLTVGLFDFELPADAKSGSYRVTYDLQNNGYVDFLFNKEDVAFEFNPGDSENTLVFKKSKENLLFEKFTKNISSVQYKIDSLQSAYFKTPTSSLAEDYKKLLIDLEKVQNSYIQNSRGTLAYHFIKATNRYNSPQIAKQPQEYLNNAVTHFFDEIDFSSRYLYNSSFLIDRIADYVFYMNFSQDPIKQKELYKKAITTSLNKVTTDSFKVDVLEFLISQFSSVKNAEIVDYLFAEYYDKLPSELQNKEFKTRIVGDMSVAIGRIAPDFYWKENEVDYSLSSLTDGLSYLLIFYSTSCSHCLREVPQVYDFLKGKNNTKVIAFAMETEDITWKKYQKQLPGWHHVLGLGKWENKIARKYQINSTPTYFVLGINKKIISNPEKIEDLKLVLEQLN